MIALNEAALLEVLNRLDATTRVMIATHKQFKLIIPPDNYRQALKILRGPHWHHKHTPRWRYLQKRGARK